MARLHHEFFERMKAPLHGHFSDGIRTQIRTGVEQKQIRASDALDLFSDYAAAFDHAQRAKVPALTDALKSIAGGRPRSSAARTVGVYREAFRRIASDAQSHRFFQSIKAPLYGHFAAPLRVHLEQGVRQGAIRPEELTRFFNEYHGVFRTVEKRGRNAALGYLNPIRNFTPLRDARQTLDVLRGGLSNARRNAELATSQEIPDKPSGPRAGQSVLVGPQKPGTSLTPQAPTRKHVVVIPTQNRPMRMRRAVADVISHVRQNGYGGPVEILVVDDSTQSDAMKKNRSLVSGFRGKLPENVKVDYYGKSEQDTFVRRLQGSIASEGSRPLDEFLKISPSSDRRGFGGARNLASLIALHHANPQDIVTFFDDDTSMRNVYAGRGADGQVKLRFGHITDHFRSLDRIFSDRSINVVGGQVTKDILESHEFVGDALRKAGHFFEGAATHPENQKIGNFRTVLSSRVPFKDVPFGQALKLMGRYAENVRKNGTYHLRIRLYDGSKPLVQGPDEKFNDWLGGANISVRASALARGVPYPTSGLRGEDICWSKLMNHIVGGVRRANIPVSHFKAGQRDVLSEIAQNVAYAAIGGNVNRAIEQSSKSHGSVGRALQNTMDPKVVERIIQDALTTRADEAAWRKYADKVRQRMKQQGWWHKPRYHEATRRIERMLDHFTQPDVQRIIRSKGPQPEQLADGLRHYGRLIQGWPAVLQGLRRMKNQENPAAAS